MPNIKPHALLGAQPRSVDNLPTEILAEVFSNIVTSHSYHYTDQVATLLEKEALAFRHASQVSQFWRNVALHYCEYIWGSIINIDRSSYAWVKELVTRSKNSPLTIQSLYNRRRRNEDFHADKWTFILAHMHRIKVLHFKLDRYDDASPLMYATSLFDAPILESFRVGYLGYWGEDPNDDLFSFNGLLFGNHYPKLKDFVLKNVLFIRPTMDFSTICLVHLDVTPDCFSVGPTVSQWLDVLESQPSLRYLTMNVQPMPGAEVYPAFSRQVHLPNLVQLFIETAGIEGAHIFASLVLPSRCRIGIQITEEEETFDDLSFIETFGESLTRCIKRWSGKGSPKHLELGKWGLLADEEFFILHLGFEDDAWQNHRIQLRYQCTYDSEDDTSNVFPVLSSFIDVIRRKGIIDAADSCALELEIPIPNNIGLMALLLQCCRGITHLRLMGRSLWFVKCLLPEPGSGAVLFPSLNHVTLDILTLYIGEFGLDEAYGCFERFLHSISATGRGIPTTSLRIGVESEKHVEFAEKVKSSFGSEISEPGSYGGFKELMESRYWVGHDELAL